MLIALCSIVLLTVGGLHRLSNVCRETGRSNKGPGNHVPLKIAKETWHIWTGADSGGMTLSSDVYREIGLSCKRGNSFFSVWMPQSVKVAGDKMSIQGKTKFRTEYINE